MLAERLHHLLHHASREAVSTTEHEAIVELLVLTAFSDHRISQDELDALEIFDLEHSEWDSGAFSVHQYVPVAMAKVRRALDSDGGADELLGDAAVRLSTPESRTEAVEACRALATTDGSDPSEVAFVIRLAAALA
jgi:hypothetical protein